MSIFEDMGVEELRAHIKHWEGVESSEAKHYDDLIQQASARSMLARLRLLLHDKLAEQVQAPKPEQPSPQTTYEIRVFLPIVGGKRVEVVGPSLRGCSERTARLRYEELVKGYPDWYFELVKVEHTETCLDYTRGR